MFQTADRALKLLALLIIVIIGASGVYAARGMYSDGSFWLVEMLPRGGFYFFDPHRAYVQVLVQAPVALAIWLGTLDLNTLIRIHSFGFVGVPLVFWVGALALQFGNRLFWFFLIALTVSYLRSNFFAAGEFSVAYSMTAFCASVLLRQKIHFLQAVLMVLTAVALTHSYEATLFLGTFLVVLSLIRLIKVPEDKQGVRILILVSIVIFLFSIYVGARSTFFQRSYDGKGAANLGALTEIHMMYLMAVPALIVLLCTGYSRRLQPWLFGTLIVLAGLYLIYAFRLDRTNISYGYFSYAYRALCCFLLLGVLTLATALRFWSSELKVQPESGASGVYLALASMAFFGSMSGLMLYHTYGYYKWAQRFELEAIALKENTPIDKTAINTNHGWTHGYNWMWGNPSTSILLRGNAEAMVLNNSNHKGPEPGQYENVKTGGEIQPMDKPRLDPYPLRPFEKSGLLFPKHF
jgi:hypothetical protein